MKTRFGGFFCCLFLVSLMHLVVLMWLADSVIQVAYCC
ncbi:Uncharacterised protein [Escherichia coli]|uniref:Uncharacterized protein n=1 Tax=Escherichia coli TaxID=562 RepID=A0A2X7GAS9_ECOLX|nr:Uncharacterised protein [Escherichia coli]SQP88712.1 Uncharacterised protein [Escherichia coli]SQQ48063.1 Uncharacterised protein [Escherichia coli]SQR21135.1 Uncharacterised protein [Escherichia coli]SQZ60313.1 Uncharacterised protein [Escherichia coli]